MFKQLFKIAAIFLLTFIYADLSFASSFRVSLRGFGGYTHVNKFSNSGFDSSPGAMTGYNAGGSLLTAFGMHRVRPILGAGAYYYEVNSTTYDKSRIYQYKNTLSGNPIFGTAGLVFDSQRFHLYLLGNGGYDPSGSLNVDVANASSRKTISTSNLTLKNNYVYGGSLDLIFRVTTDLRLGVGGTFNIHSADFYNKTSGLTTPSTFQEASANVIISFGGV